MKVPPFYTPTLYIYSKILMKTNRKKYSSIKVSELNTLIREGIRTLITERFLNFFSKEEIEPYIEDIWNIMQRTYQPIGGFKTADSPEELLKKVGMAKLVRKNDKIVAAALYKDSNGRKAIAKGSDGSKEGKLAVKQMYLEDVKFNRAWGEFSGKAEELLLRYGGVPVSNDAVEAILGKKVESKDKDGFHYTRLINGKPVRKIMIGNVKK